MSGSCGRSRSQPVLTRGAGTEGQQKGEVPDFRGCRHGRAVSAVCGRSPRCTALRKGRASLRALWGLREQWAGLQPAQGSSRSVQQRALTSSVACHWPQLRCGRPSNRHKPSDTDGSGAGLAAAAAASQMPDYRGAAAGYKAGSQSWHGRSCLNKKNSTVE